MNLKIRDKFLNLEQPKIMAILNVTPDSFFDGGKFNTEIKVLKQVEKFINEGADIIDIGGYSSRPGAQNISIETELKRVISNIKLIRKEFPEIFISIDTFRSEVARESYFSGADIINDISGGNLDTEMLKTVGELGAPYILMHMRGNPQNMSLKTNYKNITQDILDYLSNGIELAKANGINDIIVDPGFGFAKNIKQNFSLLNNLKDFKVLNYPILVGISRKSMIYKTLNIDVQEALNGTTVLHTVALLKGANIIRTHDVKELMECIKLIDELDC
jgi:dihydropteroate synthase